MNSSIPKESLLSGDAPALSTRADPMVDLGSSNTETSGTHILGADTACPNFPVAVPSTDFCNNILWEIPTSPVSGYNATKDIEALRADSPALNPLTGTDARSDARTSLTIIYPTTDTADDTADSGESGLRITWWRLLNSVVLVVFGVVKAVKAFQGKAIISNAFDVVLGVIWALIAMWMFSVEVESPTTWAWFLQVNRKREIRFALKQVIFLIGIVLYVSMTLSVTVGITVGMHISMFRWDFDEPLGWPRLSGDFVLFVLLSELVVLVASMLLPLVLHYILSKRNIWYSSQYGIVIFWVVLLVPFIVCTRKSNLVPNHRWAKKHSPNCFEKGNPLLTHSAFMYIFVIQIPALVLYAISVAVVPALCLSAAQQGITMMVSRFRGGADIPALRVLTPAVCLAVVLPIVSYLVGYLVSSALCRLP